MPDTVNWSDIFEAGMSATLKSLFRGLAEEEGWDGNARFRFRDRRKLAEVIACRTYAKPMLELCHLARVAMLLERRARFEVLFWSVMPAAPANFRDYIQNAYVDGTAGLTVGAEGAVLTYPDGDGFTVTYPRMGFLAAYMAFLIGVLGFKAVADVLAPLGQADCTAKTASEVSNALSKQLYHFLKDHLPSAQRQKQFRQTVGYLEERYGDAFTMEDIDDACILDFWRDFSEEGDAAAGDFKGFSGVFENFARLDTAMRHGRNASTPLQADASDTDEDHGFLGETLHAFPDQLIEPPADKVKFLNKGETDCLVWLLPHGPAVLRWTRSYLRSQSFGKGQARLSQGLRRKLSAKDMAGLIADPAPVAYPDEAEAVCKLDSHLEKVLLATLYVATCRAPAHEDDDVVAVDFAAQGKARQAFHNLSRKGFQEEALSDPEIAQAFEIAADCLPSVRAQLKPLLARLQDGTDWQQAFEADKPLFVSQFERIYGEAQ